MTFARSKSKEGPDRLRRRLLVAGAAAALCPAHALAGHREDLQQDWDVIVIGTGMAGLTAAVSAREAGAVRVLLLEKGPLVGGHTLYAAGSVAVLSPRRQAPIGFTDSVELWIQDAIKAGGTVLRPHITRIATESEAAVDWLEGLGLVMTRTAYQAVGDMHPRSVTALGLAAGRRFVIALHENARMLGVTTALNTRAVRLGRAEEDGLVRVVVKRTLPGGEVRDEVLRAGGIVIATGGFTADVGRRLLYDDRLTVDVPTTANPQGLYFDGATGDGLDLGAMVGGHTVGMSNIILLPYAGGRLLDYVGGDIYVNSSGERFMNEAMPIYDISEAILAQPGRTCWVITDSRSRKGGTLGLKLADGTVRRSNTIEEMARAMDVPVNPLRRTISEYNEDAAKGLDHRFGKRIFTQAIDSPPYYWGREAVYVHMTLGGLAVSSEARLLDRRGMPIPGFWAAGETTGGIFGRGRPGGMSLITCLVQGRDAGRAAAERSLALKPKAKKSGEVIRPDRAGCGILVHGTRAAAVAALDPAVARLHRERRLDVKVRDVDARALEEFKALAAAVERVVVDVGDAALLDEECAVDAGAVRDEDGGTLAGVAVLRELRDGVELGVLHFGTGHETAVHLHFAAVVVARGHAVPAE